MSWYDGCREQMCSQAKRRIPYNQITRPYFKWKCLDFLRLHAKATEGITQEQKRRFSDGWAS